MLPFKDVSLAKDQAYFSYGISEDLPNPLAKLPQLQVTARTSSFAFKCRGLGVPEIASRLHVAHVLEGSVKKALDQVRITVTLVYAATDTQRWSQTWDRKLDDVFRIQDEVAGEAVKALQVELPGTMPSVRQTDPQAYALYRQVLGLDPR